MWLSHPTPTLTGEWLMTMVHDILKQMPGLGQPQRKFLATLFITILVLRGRVNFRNLSRYCDYAERTIARQFREPFDWPDFHQRVLRTAIDPRSALVSAHDASFIPRGGMQTFVLGHLDRTEVGLKPRFVKVEPPSDADATAVLQQISRRVIRTLRRLGYLEAGIDAAMA